MRRAIRFLCQLAVTVLAGGFVCASLVRFSPGYGSSEDELDIRRSASTLERLRGENRQSPNIVEYYAHFVTGYLKGDFGRSSSLRRPSRELIAERISETAAAGLAGLVLAWCLTAGVSLLWLASRRASKALVSLSSASLQSIPAGVLALCLFLLGGHGARQAGLAIGLIVYPRVAQFTLNILGQAWQSPHVLLARAKGLREWDVLIRHVVPVCAAPLLSVLGLSVSLTAGAVIPVEAILDVSGVGQLAWQAALSRDLNLLVNITVLMTLVITVSNTFLQFVADLLTHEREAVA